MGEDELAKLVHRHLETYAGSAALAQFLDAAERALLVESLRRTQGNQTQAARLLGIPRPTLHAKLRKYGLDRGNGMLA